jgi:hypothetical protein
LIFLAKHLYSCMPAYYFSNPEDESEIVEIFQSMNDAHEYHKDGVKWDRVWCNPQLNCHGTEIDPNDSNKFIEKTGKMKGTYGDMIDYSKEMSEKRKDQFGYDPVQQKHFDNYQKSVGKKHLLDKRADKTYENDFISIETEGEI